MIKELISFHYSIGIHSTIALARRASKNFNWQEEAMKTRYTVALSVLGGLAIGATAVQAIHAQGKPPAYVIAEVDVTNPADYDKEYVPGAAKAIGDAGG